MMDLVLKMVSGIENQELELQRREEVLDVLRVLLLLEVLNIW